MTSARSLGAEFLLLGGSTVLLQGARFAYSLVVAGSAPAATLTAWALLVAAMGYAPALLLGVLNGMNREVPYLAGAGRPEEARAAEASTWLTFGVVACVIAIGAATTLLFGASTDDILAIALALVATIVYQLQQMTMRSRLAFAKASVQQVSFGGFTLVAGLVLLSQGPTSFAGVALTYTVGLLASCVVGVLIQAPALRGATPSMWRRLLRIGFPIMVAGVLFTFFVTADRWVATTLLGPVEAAPYALASLIGSAMLVLPTVISQQTYPRMAIAYGKDHDQDSILAMARGQGLIAFAITTPVALIGAVVVALVIPRVLPAYSDSVWPAVIILFGLAPFAAFTGYGNYLNVVGRQWTFLAVQVTSLLVGIALMVGGATRFGIVGIAIGAAIAYFVYGSSLALVSIRGRRIRVPPDARGDSLSLPAPHVEEL